MLDHISKPASTGAATSVLEQYGLLHEPTEPALMELAKLATQLCGLPLGCVTIADGERTWVKAAAGVESVDDIQDIGLCRDVIRNAEPKIVPTVAVSANDQERYPRPVRFYAGVPLISPDQVVIGALAVMDYKSGSLSGENLSGLNIIASQIVHRLESVRQQKSQRYQASQRDRALASKTSVIDAVPASVAVLDHEGTIVETNVHWRRFARDNDYKDDRYGLGQNYLSVCQSAAGQDGEDASAVSAGLLAVLRGQQKGFAHEYPCHSNDQKRWFRMMAERLPRADMRMTEGGGAVVMHIDITQRKLAEKDGELMKFAVDNATDGMVWVRQDGSQKFVNRAMTRISGFDKDELRRMTVFDSLPTLTPELWEKQWGEMRRWGAMSCESPAVRKDGRPLNLELRTNFFEYEGDEYSFASIRDVTDVAQTRKDVALQARRHETLVRLSRQSWQNMSLPSFLQHTAELVVDALDLDFGVALRESGEQMRLVARTGLDAWKDDSLSIQSGHMGMLREVIRDGNARFVDDWSAEEGSDAVTAFEPVRSAGARSSAVIPVRDAQRVWGVLAFGSRYLHAFSEDEQRFLMEVGSLVSEQLHRHQARDELRHSQHLLQVGSRTLQLGGWSLDLPDHRLHWSDEICEILGFPPGEVPSVEDALALYPDQMRQRATGALRDCLDHGRSFELELEIDTRRHERLRVLVIGYAVRDEDNRIKRLEGAFQKLGIVARNEVRV